MRKRAKRIQIPIIKRIFLIPFISIVIGIVGIAYISSVTAKNSMLDEMKSNGVNMAGDVIDRIDDNQEALSIINLMLEKQIQMVANMVVNSEDDLSNEVLGQISARLGISQLNWYNNSGEIIYSNANRYIGWQAPKGHPVDRYRKSGKTFFVEDDIRKSSESDLYGKNGYLKTRKGEFVQVVIGSNDIKRLTQRFEYQNLVEDLALNDSIIYALYVDQKLKVASHNYKEYIGMDLSDHLGVRSAVIRGEAYTAEHFDRDMGLRIYDVIVPVMVDGQAVGALNLGYSMKNVQSAVRRTNFNIYMLGTLLLIVLVFIFRWVQKKQVINPIIELERDVGLISLEETMGFRLPMNKNDPFIQIRKMANRVLNQTQIYFERMIENQQELLATNEELEATLGQLSANEQQLMSQYDEIMEQNKYIEFLANHDTLTGLPNRREFTRVLKESLENGVKGAVLLLDIDDFKNINDALGHVYGDKVLKYVANLLQEVSCQNATAYRFGGDEFLINIHVQSDFCAGSACMKSILDCFKTSHWIDGIENHISVSTGIACYPQDGEGVDDLLMKADIAMYSAKRAGKNQYVFFGDHMTSSFLRKIKIEKILRKATEEKGFLLLYQPVIETITGEIAYFEALIRIRGKNISPGEFIPVAEETRLVLPMGRWVIKEAIRQIRKWKNEGYRPKPIAINLSPKQMEDEFLVEFLANQIKESKIDPSLIEIEITENLLLENRIENIKTLEKIQSLGISISLDDFGTGYSSLNYLTYIPVDKVKLDKSLKDKFIYHENSQVIHSIISLIHSLKLKVVVEGIEEINEFIRLREAGSDYLQGYLFSKPIPSSEVKELFKKNYLGLINN